MKKMFSFPARNPTRESLPPLDLHPRVRGSASPSPAVRGPAALCWIRFSNWTFWCGALYQELDLKLLKLKDRTGACSWQTSIPLSNAYSILLDSVIPCNFFYKGYTLQFSSVLWGIDHLCVDIDVSDSSLAANLASIRDSSTELLFHCTTKYWSLGWVKS